MRKASWFTRFAKKTAQFSGRPATCALAGAIVVLWAISGPIFGYNETWQLTINTFTTIVTFLMVFLIQSTQNRDSEAMQVKLDEIIRAIGNAKNEVLDLEELEEEELDEIRATYTDMAQKAREGRSKEKAPRRSGRKRS
jgi:low affinity Fe/Cu permease